MPNPYRIGGRYVSKSTYEAHQLANQTFAKKTETNRASSALEHMLMGQAGGHIFDMIQTLSEAVHNVRMTQAERDKAYTELFKQLFVQMASMSLSFALYRTTSAIVDIPFFGPLIAGFVSAAGGWAITAGTEMFTGMFS